MTRYLLFRVCEIVFGLVPRRAGYAVVEAVMRTALWLRPGVFSGLRSNLRQAVPDAGEAELDGIVRRNVDDFARFWVDLFKLPRLSHEQRTRLLTIEGEPNLEAALAGGKGCLALSIHYGSWDACATYWGDRPEPASLIAEVLEPPALFRRVRQIRESIGIQVIPLGRSAPREILRRLKDNGIVGGAVDRDVIGNGKPFLFFGRPAPIPTGLFEIAQRTGASILPVVAVREPGDTYKFKGFEPLWVAPGEAGVAAAVRRVLAVFEGEIRRRPEQWHVLQPIWPAATATGAVEARQEVGLG